MSLGVFSNLFVTIVKLGTDALGCCIDEWLPNFTLVLELKCSRRLGTCNDLFSDVYNSFAINYTVLKCSLGDCSQFGNTFRFTESLYDECEYLDVSDILDP